MAIITKSGVYQKSFPCYLLWKVKRVPKIQAIMNIAFSKKFHDSTILSGNLLFSYTCTKIIWGYFSETAHVFFNWFYSQVQHTCVIGMNHAAGVLGITVSAKQLILGGGSNCHYFLAVSSNEDTSMDMWPEQSLNLLKIYNCASHCTMLVMVSPIILPNFANTLPQGKSCPHNLFQNLFTLNLLPLFLLAKKIKNK